MLKNLSLILIVIVVGILTSCTFTEKIYINEDGTGTYAVDMDMGQVMQYTKNLSKSLGEDEDSSIKETAIPEKVDTVVYFSEMLKNKEELKKLTPEQIEVLKSLEGGQMKMHIDEAKAEMQMIFSYDFNKTSDLKDMHSKISEALRLTKEDQSSAFGAMPTTSQTNYEYSNSMFKRSVSMANQTKEQKAEIEKSMEQMGMFLAGSFYKLEYHFPKAINSTTAKNATFSEDRKTLFITNQVTDVLQDESILDFEVRF